MRLFIGLTCIAGPGAELRELGAALRNPAQWGSALPRLAGLAARRLFMAGVPALQGLAPELQAEGRGIGRAAAQLQMAGEGRDEMAGEGRGEMTGEGRGEMAGEGRDSEKGGVGDGQ